VPENVHSVSIGELKISGNPNDLLIAYGLGSCVAVCMYDATARIGGMIHSLLPQASRNNNGVEATTAKFVDVGVPLLVDALTKMGAERRRFDVYLCGGAQMLSAPGFSNSLNIGERNVHAAEAALSAAGFRIRAQDTGGTSGRTVRLRVDTGEIVVKTLGQGERILNPSLTKVK